MDIISHALWAAAGAKAAGKKSGKKIDPWLTGFWGAFPDLLAFTPLFVLVLWSVLAGTIDIGSPSVPAFDQYQNPVQYAVRNLTGLLYSLGHSAVVWLGVFGLFWVILRRPVWELFGWLSHIVLDIFTHPAGLYPTPFLWPFSEYRFDGIAWATPEFLIPNYILLGIVWFVLLKGETGTQPLSKTKRTFLAIFIVVSLAGLYFVFAR
jgi:hypothetical protein